ncbi:permease-like cell division protein FtsX [Krasilnikovia sp. MM14-A1004]|uniref:permease-like cell division protein FtsX n=1 Tax=Krasilnikovia sp. MM14-A1004 TaxID=3373541 RepID=UPI00399CAB1E
MEQNLRGLFERALDDEPVPPPGDPALTAMVRGRGIRRRRGLLIGGSVLTAVVAAVVAVNVAVTPAVPPPASVADAMVAAAIPECTLPENDGATDIFLFLTQDITAPQRSGLLDALRADPAVRDLRYESREEAFARFKELWADSPDFVQSVSPESLPQSFRVQLTEPSAYREFAARFRYRTGVAELVARACPGAGR